MGGARQHGKPADGSGHVEDGAEVFMRKWHKDEKEASTGRHRTAATATTTVDASARAQNGRGRKGDEGGEGGRSGEGMGAGAAVCPTD